MALRPCAKASSMASRCGSQALDAALGMAAFPASESVITPMAGFEGSELAASTMAGFSTAESVITPMAGFAADGHPTARSAIPAARR